MFTPKQIYQEYTTLQNSLGGAWRNRCQRRAIPNPIHSSDPYLKWLLPDVPIVSCFVFGFFNLSAKSWTQVPDLTWATEESWQGNGTLHLAQAQTSSTETNISISALAAL